MKILPFPRPKLPRERTVGLLEELLKNASDPLRVKKLSIAEKWAYKMLREIEAALVTETPHLWDALLAGRTTQVQTLMVLAAGAYRMMKEWATIVTWIICIFLISLMALFGVYFYG